jgi:hypothetical protein
MERQSRGATRKSGGRALAWTSNVRGQPLDADGSRGWPPWWCRLDLGTGEWWPSPHRGLEAVTLTKAIARWWWQGSERCDGQGLCLLPHKVILGEREVSIKIVGRASSLVESQAMVAIALGPWDEHLVAVVRERREPFAIGLVWWRREATGVLI